MLGKLSNLFKTCAIQTAVFASTYVNTEHPDNAFSFNKLPYTLNIYNYE